MNCPACSDTRAYIGFREVECPSLGCKYFSERLFKELDWILPTAAIPEDAPQVMASLSNSINDLLKTLRNQGLFCRDSAS